MGLWIATMLLAIALPASAWKKSSTPLIFFDVIFPVLFVAATVLGVMRVVAYVRWTGKYPYYFLFGRAQRSGDGEGKGQKSV